VSETHSRRKHERKGEARLGLVGTRLPHWVEFQCEKFNPVTRSLRGCKGQLRKTQMMFLTSFREKKDKFLEFVIEFILRIMLFNSVGFK